MKVWERAKRALLAEGGLPLVWIALTIVVLIPVWYPRLLPMLDTPSHLALVRGWHSYHDPAYHISDYYTLRIRPVPYFLFYLLIHWLLYVFPIEIANKIFLSAYLILFPLSILSLARALKRSPWLVVGAFALAFNQNWIYGFSSYLMGTCFMFFSYAALIKYMADGRRTHLITLGISSTLAYFGHVMPWFCFGLGAIPLLLMHWRRWQRGLWASLAMLPSVGFAIAAYVEERTARTYFKSGEGLTMLAGVWKDVPTHVRDFPRRIMELFPGSVDMFVLAIISATVIGLCIWRGVRSDDDDVVDVEYRQLKIIIGVLGLAYLSLPYGITRPMQWWYVSPRVPSMMAPLLLLLPVAKLQGRSRLLVTPMIAAVLILSVKLTTLYVGFTGRNIGFMQLVEELPKGSNCLVVVRNMMRGAGSEEKSGDPATSAPVYWHFSSWPMALRGGLGWHVFDQGIPIVPKVHLKVPPWTLTDSFQFSQAPDFDYYIVRDTTPALDAEPAWRVVDRKGTWVLYQRLPNPPMQM